MRTRDGGFERVDFGSEEEADTSKQAVGGTVGLAVGAGLTGDPSPE
jgi:hypothetical protein